MLSATPDATLCRNIWSSLLTVSVPGAVATGSIDPGDSHDPIAIALGSDTRFLMKAKVYVTLKPSVLDPQGKAIKHSVELLGFNGISDIRQGKYFEIAIDGSQSADDARADAEKLAHDVLSNPIIEDFRVEIEQ